MLRAFLEGVDWERRKTSIPGVFLPKIPATGSRPAELAIEVNPVDSSGLPRKRRGPNTERPTGPRGLLGGYCVIRG